MRVVMHIDLNSYFVSAERRRRPDLMNKPVVVTNMGRRAVVAAASYEARPFGIHAGMPMFKAIKLCPQIIAIEHDFKLYIETSREFFDYLAKKVGDIIEIGSLDEAYIDITHIAKQGKSLASFAGNLIKRIKIDLNLPVSIGISTDKFLAKMASDMKKPLGFTIINKKNIDQKLWVLPIKEFFGIGPSYRAKCEENGIYTIGDLAHCKDKQILKDIFVNQGDIMQARALGIGNEQVSLDITDIKTIGNEHTTEFDVFEYEEIRKYLKWLTETVHQRSVVRHKKGKVISIVIRYTEGKVKQWKTVSKQKKLEFATNDFNKMFRVVMDLFDELWEEKPVRKLGVSLGTLSSAAEAYEPLSLFEETNSKPISVINDINYKLGKKLLMSGKEYKFNKENKHQQRFVVDDNVKPDLDKLKE